MKVDPGTDVTIINEEVYRKYMSKVKLSPAGRFTVGRGIPF